jgi:hypothetical protein
MACLWKEGHEVCACQAHEKKPDLDIAIIEEVSNIFRIFSKGKMFLFFNISTHFFISLIPHFLIQRDLTELGLNKSLDCVVS